MRKTAAISAIAIPRRGLALFVYVDTKCVVTHRRNVRELSRAVPRNFSPLACFVTTSKPPRITSTVDAKQVVARTTNLIQW